MHKHDANKCLEKGDKFSTDKLDQEIKQTSAMIRELTKKLQEREKKEEKTATRKQEITDITNQVKVDTEMNFLGLEEPKYKTKVEHMNL